MSVVVLAETGENYGLEVIDEPYGRLESVDLLKSYPPDEYHRLIFIDLEDKSVVEYKRRLSWDGPR